MDEVTDGLSEISVLVTDAVVFQRREG